MRRIREHASGFTLIELLVVIAIIAILIGMLFPAFQAVQNQARRTQAKNDLTQIVTAVNAYYTEYGKYPLAASDGVADTVFASPTNYNLFDVLRATGLGRDTVDPTNTSGNENLNLRRIVFISPPDAKDMTNPRSGIGTDRQWYDPWGVPYKVEIDGNYNGIVSAPSYTDLSPNYATATDGSGDVGVRTGVIGWSFGADLTLGTKSPASSNYKGSDDVISWQ